MSLGVKKFVDYTSLTANELNEYLMQQTVMVFASSAARTSAFTTAGVTVTEGMVSYLLDTNLTQYYDGSAWISYMTTANLVTSLPASPFDGQEISYVADSTNGVVWKFKYRSASASAYKWEFIGGQFLQSFVTTQQSTSATTTVGLGGPAVTVPFAGDYLVEGGAILAENTAGNLAGFIFKGTSDSDVSWTVTYAQHILPFGNTYGSSASAIQKKSAQSAGQSIEMRYAVSNAGTIGYFSNRYMTVLPIRVG